MRKALVIGIDYYQNANSLNGCVNDAHAVKSAVERHGDGTLNFAVNLITALDSERPVTKRQIKDAAKQLFDDDSDIALFYFSGHGYIENSGGFLLTSDCADGDDGFSMDELLNMANKSSAKNKIIILDCCHSGAAGTPQVTDNKALLSEGVTILTASSASQYALETGGCSVFTSLFVDALNGRAANLVGDITPGSVYAYIDQSLGPWEQRPIFKTNVKSFTTIRRVRPPIELRYLKRLTEFFTYPGMKFKLDPSYEPDSLLPNKENTEIFSILQKYNRVNLVSPVDEEHMYFAAMNSKPCKLTVLGEHYWNLVKHERI